MDTFFSGCIAGVNDIGRGFCTHAAGVFVQSGVLIVVLLITDLLLRRHIRATLRYWIWMLVIVKLLLPPTFSLPTGVGHWAGRYVALPASVAPHVLGTPSRYEIPEEPLPPDTVDWTSAPPLQRPDAGIAAATAEPVSVRGEQLTWRGGALLLWGIGVLGFAPGVIRRALFVRALMVRGRPAEGGPVDLLDECCRHMNIHRQVRMKLLPGAFSPAVCGLWRPTILLPETLPVRLTPDSLRAVLIHELAHVKRGDLWINCVQTILQVIYFYNPLVWLANAIVRRVREQAVDEMSLVALGAEARSYGSTLIDIAEMTFWRANPALGLVGVAESKKSLEGRIRYMITRPIPRNAKVGATGALAIVVMGALMLPMAAARTDSERAGLAAHLPGGATIELVGVCNWPTPEPTCWQPDGSKLDPPLRVTKRNQSPGANSYGFILKITGPEDLKRSWRKIEGATGWEASCDVVDSEGNRLEGYTAAIALFEKARPETTVEVGLAAGPWNTIATDDDKDQMQTGHSGVLWSQAFETSRGTSIVASTAWDKMVAHRVVAIDTEGVVHTTQEGGSVASGAVEQFTAHFPGLRRDQIRQFQYQVRPFAWAVFERISLLPGVKTSPQVQTSSQPKASRTLSTGEVRPAERTESAKVDIAIGDKDLRVTRLSERLFEATIVLRNNGSVPLPQFRVNFYAGDPDKGGRLLSPQQAGPIMPGNTWAEYNPALELRPGESVISVVVDPDNRVEESDETNNKASRNLSGMVSESEQVVRVGAIRKLDLSGDDLFQVEAQASEGFHFPYYLFIPGGIDKDSPAYMLVETNNSGMVSDDPEVHRVKALMLVKSSYANRMARRLGVPLLVPTFPRPRPETHNWAYTHALDIDTLEIEEGELRRIDLQLTAMIQHAQKLLRTSGFQIHEKVLMHGFSASAKFCNRYCYLHPDMVKAAAAGGVNGLPTLPVREWNGYELPFPIGLAGMERFTGKPFDEKAFREVAQYIYMGSADRNDTLLSREAWREEEAAIIRKALAAEKMMPDRWEVSRSIYRQQQLPAQLVTYDGVGHSIQSEMLDDVVEFFKANAGEKYVPIEPSAVRR